jgi:hypothetical protein
MKSKSKIRGTSTIIILTILFLASSCRKNFNINEFENLNNDSLSFEGSLAGPVINTELKLVNFVPENDSSLWIEIDENDLIHLRMYYKDLIVVKMQDIYPTPDVLYPAAPGIIVPAKTKELKTDTSKMKVYSNILTGKLYFQNPSFKFNIRNYIPVVTFFNADTLTFYNYENTAISHTEHTEYHIPAPSGYGTYADTSIIIDTASMPVLDDVFAPVPRFFSFSISTGSHNPQVLPYGVTGEEEMHIDVDVDLPLDARLETIVMSDTINFMWDSETFEQIKSATLKVRFKNGFPIDGFSQIYITDTTATGDIGNIIDSLFTDTSLPDVTNEGWHLNPAETDAQGIVTISDVSEIIVSLSQERLNFLINSHASRLLIVGKLNSYLSNTGFFVKLLGKYTMGVQIAVKVDYDTN